MMTLIVTENEAGQEAIKRVLAAAEPAGIDTIIVIAERIPPEFTGNFIPARGQGIADALRNAVSRCSGGNVAILVDARASVATSHLCDLMASMRNSHAGVSYAPVSQASRLIDLPESEPASSLRAISRTPAWPTACVAIRGNSVESPEDFSGESYAAVIAGFFARSMARGNEIDKIADAVSTTASCDIPASTRASMIEGAVSASNIEELFPNHPWTTHQDESLAACYHTVAAMLIGLGKTDAAMECLRQSDALEDSPRSLALKAIISRLNGETLGAVANMVSSLQQYEQRKRDASGHYLSFSPKDMEAINNRLKSGLAALNRRDNENALRQFSEAVFNFDPFYSEFGLDMIESQ